jgi:hypothetical protein
MLFVDGDVLVLVLPAEEMERPHHHAQQEEESKNKYKREAGSDDGADGERKRKGRGRMKTAHMHSPLPAGHNQRTTGWYALPPVDGSEERRVCGDGMRARGRSVSEGKAEGAKRVEMWFYSSAGRIFRRPITLYL